ncbi:MAG: hypothetical protein LBN39_00095, partial [Planctomycetaceae bacterium]|nr:hypothetical protein [Planctomycetaceae bacterium]
CALPIYLIAKHYELLRRQFDERLAVVLLQKSVCHYATGLPGARQFRNALGNTKDKETFFQSVNNFFRQPPEN